MAEAVERFVPDGVLLASGDFGRTRVSMVAIFEINRHKRRRRRPIDRFGNVNTTVIRDYDRPKVRLPGNGGANDVGSFCHHTIVVIRQDRRKFVDKLGFITTPGYLTGPGARERAGLPSGSGPVRVITQLAEYGSDLATREMELCSLHPDVTDDEARAGSGFRSGWPRT